MAPVTVAESWCNPSLPLGTADRDSDALDVTDPPGCVAIDVSEEFAALFYFKFDRTFVCLFFCFFVIVSKQKQKPIIRTIGKKTQEID